MSEDSTPATLTSIEDKQRALKKQLEAAHQSCQSLQRQINQLKTDHNTQTSIEQASPPPLPEAPTPSPQKSAPTEEKSPPTPDKPQASNPLPTPPSTSDIELKIGQTWFVRIGLLSLLTGLIFFK